MANEVETREEGAARRAGPGSPAVPGVLVIASLARPVLHSMRLRGDKVVIGRDSLDPLGLGEAWLSRRHVEIRLARDRWTIVDAGSRNGTFVDGERVDGAVSPASVRVVRAGRTLLMPVRDVRRFEGADVSTIGGRVIGPTLREALDRVREAAEEGGETLLIRGESGTGKEGAATLFHAAGARASRPFVAVNCATLQESIAERQLFGARRGAFSGANADARGFVQSADGGVLFLDEVGELSLAVQAKLLRLLEQHEVVPVGAPAPERVDVRICFATHRDLRSAAAAGRFRDDLYYRIADREVVVPPLRERIEEIPWLVAAALALEKGTPTDDGRLFEACAVRHWPGNVRELMYELRGAARAARREAGGRVASVSVGVDHLDGEAGVRLSGSDVRGAAGASNGTAPENLEGTEPTRDAIETILRAHQGNVSATARALGLHRAQVYRLKRKFGIEDGGVSDDEAAKAGRTSRRRGS